MKAIAIVPGTTTLHLVDRPMPSITAPDEVMMRVLCVGICGTDREEVGGGRTAGPAGQQELVIGHEMLGRVVEVGRSVTRVQPGDYAAFTVRRGCGKCLSCGMNRPDMCRTGDYRERGIWGLDGYQAEYVVDREPYVVQVPPELKSVGVLSEPLSVAEKAIDEAVRVQSARLPDAPATPDWLHGRRCLVAGLGPIGLLAAMALRLRGAEVYGLDVVDAETARPQWLAGIGGRYVDARQVPVDRMAAVLGPVEMILEATGVASLEFNLLDALAPDGIYVLTGIPGGNRPLEVPGAELIRRMVLGNQVMVGSVNAARDHFQMGVNDLARAHLLWGDHVEQLITHRHPFTDFEAALRQHPTDEIKSVIEWTAD
ncbi:MAG: glucose 1-dehydrogenase [Candidatus Methylomirabilota bacterium]|jgi:threonine dehydrogenase-like Zn-dependent dehydrogenase